MRSPDKAEGRIRDADPTFASTVAIPAFQNFIKNPADAASIAKSMEQQKKSIYTS